MRIKRIRRPRIELIKSRVILRNAKKRIKSIRSPSASKNIVCNIMLPVYCIYDPSHLILII